MVQLLIDRGYTDDAPELDMTVTQVRDRVTTVVVTARFPGRVVTGFGGSVCDQIDKPDSELGEELALGRALKDLGRKLTSDAWGRARG